MREKCEIFCIIMTRSFATTTHLKSIEKVFATVTYKTYGIFNETPLSSNPRLLLTFQPIGSTRRNDYIGAICPRKHLLREQESRETNGYITVGEIS